MATEKRAAKAAGNRPKAGKRPPTGGVAASASTRIRYTTEERAQIHDAVCEAIASGLSSVKACELVGVSRVTWDHWMADGLTDSSKYTRARETRSDLLVDEMQAIADDESLDPQSRRVRVDTRKWIASRMFPKRWGDKMDVTTDGKPLEMAPVVILPAVAPK